MIAVILIALAAGCASALMFASIISGALISLLLLYLAPLPLMVAALGWGPLCASIGGIGAATVLGAMFGLPYCLAFVVTVALPAWWLGHLVLLGRPGNNSVAPGNGAAAVAPDLEWYPVGRILLWIAGFAALATMAALLTLGTDGNTITATLRRGLLQILSGRDAGSTGEIEQFIDALVKIAPAAATMVAMMTLTLNLWLAARITATSGRLHRPWPRPEAHDAAADDARDIMPRARVLLYRRIAGDPGADRQHRFDDGLRPHRLCGAASVDAAVQEPAALAKLQLCRRGDVRLAGYRHGDPRHRGHRFRFSSALSAREAAAHPRVLNSSITN